MAWYDDFPFLPAQQAPLDLSDINPPIGGGVTGPGTMGRGALTPPPPLAPPPAIAPTSPEAMSPALPPPPVVAPATPVLGGGTPPGTLPLPGAGFGSRAGREGDLDIMQPGRVGAAFLPPTDVGARAGGLGAPEGPTSLGGPGGPTPLPGAPPTTGQKMAGLAQALKGVKMPANPEVQRVSTPAAPRPTGAIKGGDLQALLMALNAGGGGGGGLPPTLGKLIGRG